MSAETEPCIRCIDGKIFVAAGEDVFGDHHGARTLRCSTCNGFSQVPAGTFTDMDKIIAAEVDRLEELATAGGDPQ